MTELQRLRQVIALQGEDRARKWASGHRIKVFLSELEEPGFHAKANQLIKT